MENCQKLLAVRFVFTIEIPVSSLIVMNCIYMLTILDLFQSFSLRYTR